MCVTRQTRGRRGGFSLIEVNIALLVVGVGLVALLGLFPVGLRQGNLATSDTAQAMFADQVLAMFHANAGTITNWPDWKDMSTFKSRLLNEAAVPVAGSPDKSLVFDTETTISDYLVKGNTIIYLIKCQDVREPVDYGGRLRRVWIQTSDRPKGTVVNSPSYCCDLVFSGETR